ncbi:nucleoside/nucleotide kinase family protein [Streptomyces sp. NPDC094437]|uniref:nucleoside/nucleotide kinase family protein n=1 Tax=Streptomyces sp. NPDC094437 TaxID=3366060 RepID=UPI00380120B6
MTPTGGGTGPADAPLYRHPCLDALVERALGLADGGRALLGIVGEPGAGKSTFAEQLLARLESARPGCAVAVSMDGFHLAHKVVRARGQTARKGTIGTFDAHGFAALLRRTRAERQHTVWWPEFDRALEDPVAAAIEVTAGHRLVVVDGNFLLSEQGPWREVGQLLDESWFLDALPEPRRARLVRRYVEFGFTPEAARAKALGVDEETSTLIRATAARADLVLGERG